MRILIAADTYYPHVNGASYFAQRLAYYLQKHGNTVAVIAPSETYSDTKENVNSVLVYGVKSFPIFVHPSFRFSAPVFKKFTEKVFDEFKPDIVHLQSHFFIDRIVLKVAKKRGISVVATNHFMPENIVHYVPLPKAALKIITKLAWRDFVGVFKQVRQITTPTETAANLIREGLKKPVKAISCGIDFEKFNTKTKGEHLKKRYHIPKGPVLLWVGRLDKDKNVDMTLHAVARALKKVNFHFVIAGVGAEQENLEDLAKKLKIQKHVTFAGFVPDKDLPSLYKIANCFAIAGIAELQSIVTMEAMASGLPIIGVNATALPELVHDGKNGFLFEIGDVNTYANSIVKIFSDEKLRERMSKASLDIIKKHDINKTIAEFESIYKEELKNKKK